MRLYRRLLLAATLLAVVVIGLGAYVRLSDAGLGCPDWPGCYGHLLGVPESAHEQQAAVAAYPRQPLDAGKAWKEMIHRYAAGSLGLLILAVCLLAWRAELRGRQSPALPTVLLGLVGLQAALGMWTVTLLLKPLVVTLHLLGGMGTLALLVALALRGTAAAAFAPAVRRPAVVALLAVIGQVALGGWVSSNYAALACADFPFCQGQWLPPADFAQAFSLHRDLGYTAQGELLPAAALTAIHLAHRLGAVLVLLAVGTLAARLLRSGQRRWGAALLALLGLQLGLGIANVLLALPLPLAVAHNLGAAALLSAVLAVTLRSRAGPLPAATRPATPAAGALT
ncbi:MAG TPA: COX15/CtaA family protein [Azonexus sp.]